MAGTVLAYGAAKVAGSENGRKVIGAVFAAVIGFFFIVGSIVSSMVSIFANEKDLSSDFDGKETEVYKEIRGIYDEYVKEVEERIQQIEEELTEEYADTKFEWRYNPETEKDELVEIEYCTANFTVDYRYINTSYVMAYLSCIHRKEYMKGNININEKELKKFWDTIGGLKVEKLGSDDEPEFYMYNEVLPPEEIAELFFTNDSERKIFLESVHMISQFIGAETFIEDITVLNANQMSVPLYYQYQSPWGSRPYGNGTIAKNGCAPACIAMVFSYEKGSYITPSDIVAYTGNNYYVNGSGSSWNIFEACASEWGIDCVYIGKSVEAIVQALTSGKPVILSMGPGTFTQSGHFIVLTGINEAGMVTVNDPNDNSRKNHAGREFSISQILSEAKGGWSFN